MEWAQILVIILSIFLALFLLLGVVLLIMLIRLTRQIKTVTSSAERTANHIERLIRGVAHVIDPLVIFSGIKKILRRKRR